MEYSDAPKAQREQVTGAEGEARAPLDASEQIELCYARGWTDGLPVVPATQDLVDAMLEAAGLGGDAVVAQMPSRKVAVTAEKVAINAVMAGCKPEYMPVVAAAVKALATPNSVSITSPPRFPVRPS